MHTMTFLWGNIQLDKLLLGPNSWQCAAWSSCFPFFSTQIIFVMVEIGNSDTKILWKTPYFAHKCKAKVVSKFHLLQQLFHSEFPHLLQCSESSFGNHSAHPVHTQKTPGERHRPSCFYKGSQVSFCLRCQDKEKSCSHCPHAMIWYLRRMKKERESWENASELCISAKTSPTTFLPTMPQLIFGFQLCSPWQATLGTLQLKAGAAPNQAVRHYSCCSETRLLHSTAQSRSRNTVTSGSSPKTTISYRGLRIPQGTYKRLTLVAMKAHQLFLLSHMCTHWSNCKGQRGQQTRSSLSTWPLK